MLITLLCIYACVYAHAMHDPLSEKLMNWDANWDAAIFDSMHQYPASSLPPSSLHHELPLAPLSPPFHFSAPIQRPPVLHPLASFLPPLAGRPTTQILQKNALDRHLKPLSTVTPFSQEKCVDISSPHRSQTTTYPSDPLQRPD